MKISCTLLLLGLVASAVARPFPHANNGTIPDNVIVAALTVQHSDQHPLTDRNPALRKRASTHDVHIANEHSYYEIDLAIGTPPQNFKCLLDTGSSDLWVSSSDNPACKKPNADCSFGLFTSSRSSTWRVNSSTSHGNDFRIDYADETSAQGFWGNDLVSIAGIVSLDQCSVALATSSSDTMGVLGIGLPAYESTFTRSNPPYTYPNVPALMAQRGLISRNAYSLYLGDAKNDHGRIIFGGVDTCGYSGSLTTLPLVKTNPATQEPDMPAIQLTSLKIFSTSRSQYAEYARPVNYPVVLDSGLSHTYLPAGLVKDIYAALKAAPASNPAHGFRATCSQSGSLEFGFNGANIKVPFTEFLSPLLKSDGRAFTNFLGQKMCTVRIYDYQKAGEETPHIGLGINFLRSAYVLFDFHNKEISLAQAALRPTCTRIQGLPDPTRPTRLFKRESSFFASNSGADHPAMTPSVSSSLGQLYFSPLTHNT